MLYTHESQYPLHFSLLEAISLRSSFPVTIERPFPQSAYVDYTNVSINVHDQTGVSNSAIRKIRFEVLLVLGALIDQGSWTKVGEPTVTRTLPSAVAAWW